MDFYKLSETFIVLAFMGVAPICLYASQVFYSSDAVVTNNEVLSYVFICMSLIAVAVMKLYIISLRLKEE